MGKIIIFQNLCLTAARSRTTNNVSAHGDMDENCGAGSVGGPAVFFKRIKYYEEGIRKGDCEAEGERALLSLQWLWRGRLW